VSRWGAEDAGTLGLVTFTPDDIDWDEGGPHRDRGAGQLQPDASPAGANYRFAGPETMEPRSSAGLTLAELESSTAERLGPRRCAAPLRNRARADFDRSESDTMTTAPD